MNQGKYTQLVVILVIALFLTGCARIRVIDKISIVHQFGFDLGENGELIGTVLSPNFNQSKDTEHIHFLYGEGESSAMIVTKMSAMVSTPLEIGKMRVLVFGKEYAETGIRKMIDRIMVIPQIGTRTQIVVSTHSARETLSVFMKEKSLTLFEQIEHNIQGEGYPRMNLHYFLNHFYGEGMDPFVPMLTIDERQRVKLDGVGVFRDDRLILHLDQKQSALLSVLTNSRSEALIEITHKDGDRTDMFLLRASRTKNRWKWDKEEEKMKLHSQLKWTITQFPQHYDLQKPENIEKIRKIIVHHIKEEFTSILKTFQKANVDPIGLGNIARSQDKTWKEKEFYEKYPDLPIDVQIDLEIVHTGLEG